MHAPLPPSGSVIKMNLHQEEIQLLVKAIEGYLCMVAPGSVTQQRLIAFLERLLAHDEN
jgi:hypothetical protein